jgi:hypothetical protein
MWKIELSTRWKKTMIAQWKSWKHGFLPYYLTTAIVHPKKTTKKTTKVTHTTSSMHHRQCQQAPRQESVVDGLYGEEHPLCHSVRFMEQETEKVACKRCFVSHCRGLDFPITNEA